MTEIHYDLCVIGGGINGVGVARDAAGRGLSVLLVEAGDLACATSSSSSKLIHGGLRYLEHFEFSMVRKSLQERERLYKIAPNLVRAAECVFLQDKDQRPLWLTRIGLWLYDNIGGKMSLPKSRVVAFADNETHDKYGKYLLDDIKKAIIYSDCTVDDTRLVVLNAVDAASRKAKILTHTMCEGLKIVDGLWHVSLRDHKTNDALDISASMVVNATGPWVGSFLEGVGVGGDDPDLPAVRLVKGSHVILPKLYEGEHIYVLQQPDKRIVFVAPYEDDYTLVGTTEEDFDGNPHDARISDAEMKYLCDAINCSFSRTVSRADIVFTFSGVRPLLDIGVENFSEVSRGYLIYHHDRFDPPLLSVFGGKLTTYRALSENVVNKLMALSGRSGSAWSGKEPLAGGDFGKHDFASYFALKKQVYKWIPEELLLRYIRAYGDRIEFFLSGASELSDLGEHYGDQIYKSEIDYLVENEWAQSAEDILWRRSKLGLHVSDDTVSNIENYLKNG